MNRSDERLAGEGKFREDGGSQWEGEYELYNLPGGLVLVIIQPPVWK
jgi:hypothetical protein